MIRPCAWCKKPLEIAGPNNQYHPDCSREVKRERERVRERAKARKAFAAMKPKECAFCGEPFTTDKRTKLFCRDKCQELAYSRRHNSLRREARAAGRRGLSDEQLQAAREAGKIILAAHERARWRPDALREMRELSPAWRETITRFAGLLIG